MRILVVLALLIASTAIAQDQSLPETGYELPGGLLTLSGCRLNIETHLGRCARMDTHSEAQIGKQILCRQAAWSEYYGCTGLRPCKIKCNAVRHGNFLVCE